MEQSGLTAEMYRAVVAIVDDRMQAISVTRQDYDRLEGRLERLEATVERLAEAQLRTEAQIQDLVRAVTSLENTQAGMKGNLLELTYQHRAGSYLGPILRRVRACVPF